MRWSHYLAPAAPIPAWVSFQPRPTLPRDWAWLSSSRSPWAPGCLLEHFGGLFAHCDQDLAAVHFSASSGCNNWTAEVRDQTTSRIKMARSGGEDNDSVPDLVRKSDAADVPEEMAKSKTRAGRTTAAQNEHAMDVDGSEPGYARGAGTEANAQPMDEDDCCADGNETNEADAAKGDSQAAGGRNPVRQVMTDVPRRVQLASAFWHAPPGGQRLEASSRASFCAGCAQLLPF